jgi:hypothetical protein
MDTTDPLLSILEQLVTILIELIRTQFSDFVALFEILQDLGIFPVA